jgi:hypothetical protein
MQIRHLALDPRFKNLGGISAWVNRYSDEETLRWIGRLYRHYCIEGKRQPLFVSKGYKFKSNLIQNPEFDNGFKAWELKLAAPNSIRIETLPYYGTNRGMLNYKKVKGSGDSVAVLTSIPNKTNILKQKIKNLTVGKAYAVNLIVNSYTDYKAGIGKARKLPFYVEIKNATKIESKCNLNVTNIRGRGILPEQYIKNKAKSYINYHTVVFRAKSNIVELILKDCDSGGNRSKAGDELMVNFIQVQPYYETPME